MAPLPPLVSSALITGGVSALSNVFTNVANAFASSKSFARQKELMNLQNEYNLPINQMMRLKQAGLNPNLVYSGSNATIPSASPSSVNTPVFNSPMDASSIASVFQASRSSAETKVLESQARNLDAQARLADNQADNAITENLLLLQRVGLTVEEAKTQVTQQELNKVLKNRHMNEINLEWEKFDVDKQNAESYRRLMNSNADYYAGMLVEEQVRTGLQAVMTESNVELNSAKSYEAYQSGDFSKEQASFLADVHNTRVLRENLQSGLDAIEYKLKKEGLHITIAERKILENRASSYRLALDNVDATLNSVESVTQIAANVASIATKLPTTAPSVGFKP